MAKKKKSSQSKSRKTQKPSLMKNLVTWLFVAGLWMGILGFAAILWYGGELPKIAEQAKFEHKSSVTIKAADGSVLVRYGDIRGESVGIEDLPSHLIYAVLAIEDRRFYQHFGIDLIGLARAMVVNVTSGRTVQGGSTITQQLAKNLFLSQERTLKRKAQEALLALWLESVLTKDEILSAYLNRVYLGSGAYGVDAASKLYFGKPVQKVSIREAAMLAGLLKAPSRYSPLQNPNLAEKRTDIVLSAMEDAGFLSSSEAGQALKVRTHTAVNSIMQASSKRYYTDWVLEQMGELIGTPGENITIETTLVPEIQTAAQNALTASIAANGTAHKFSQGAIVVLHPSGAVLGMVGGYDYSKSQFNRATQARRQPGSAFKPIVFLTALEKGWHSDDLILDSPITDGDYNPKNFDNQYMGGVTLETALANSLNTATVRLMQETGVSAVINTARALGIKSPLSRDLSLALGSSGVSPLELASAYAVIANGGYAVQPYGIIRIMNDEGDLYYERPRRRKTSRVIEGRSAKELTQMMRSVIEGGTGRGARLPYPASGKTGTSQDSRDAWFSGFTDDIVTSVWLGNDDNAPMDHITGGSYPAQIWKQVMMESQGKADNFRETDILTSSFGDLLSRLTSGNDAPAEPEKPQYNP